MSDEEDGLSYCEYMQGMCNSPIPAVNPDTCHMCSGFGLMPVMCCDGYMCGCRGMPVDFVPCQCGAPQPTSAMIRSWIPERFKAEQES